MKLKNKKQCERAHAKSRAIERFGIDLIGRMRMRMIQAIGGACVEGVRATFLESESCRVSKWHIEIDSLAMTVVYDRNRQEIITVWRA